MLLVQAWPSVSGAVTNAGGGEAKLEAYSPLLYSTFFGGSGSDGIAGVTVSGNYLYIVGVTDAAVPVTKGALQNSSQGGKDIFIAKFNYKNGAVSGLAWSTMLGGSGDDLPAAIAVDGSGKIYIAGTTGSTDFPTGTDSWQGASGGSNDAFLAVLSPLAADSYTLSFLSYIGGTGKDSVSGMIADNGRVYLAGTTASADFPITKGAYNENPNGEDEVFLSIFDVSSLSEVKLLYSTYFGGDKSDAAGSLALDSTGNIIVAGNTESDDLPVTGGAFSGKFNGNSQDGFIIIIHPASGGSSDLRYSSYFGGNGDDYITCASAGENGNVIFAGNTNSLNLPTTNDAYFKSSLSNSDIFIGRLSPEGNGTKDLAYLTYFGGISNDKIYSFATDNNGFVTFTGSTESLNYPATTGSYDRTYNGMKDMYITKLNIMDNIDRILEYSAFIGANRNETGLKIVADEDYRYILGGFTDSRQFPVSTGAYDSVYDNGTDGVVCEFYLIPLKIASVSGTKLCCGDSLTVYYTAGDYQDDNVFTFELSDSAGQFTVPYQLGTLLAESSGVFGCRIPASLPYSDRYRLRVRSSNPWNIFYTAAGYLTIAPVPAPTLGSFEDICFNEPPLLLTGGMPEGGEYSGSGVNGGYFYPTEAGPGVHPVLYSVSNEFGCSGTAVSYITVRQLPPTPVITYINGRLVSTIADGNQWYLDGKKIAGEVNDTLIPSRLGSYTATVTNEYGCESFHSNPFIYNIKDTVPEFSFGTGDYAAEPGQIIKIPVYLKNDKNLKTYGIKNILLTVSFNATLLEPWYGTPAGYVRDGQRIIEAECPTDSLKNGILKELVFRATLGNDTSTTIVIKDAGSTLGSFEYTTRPSVFYLLGVCHADGLRLVGSFGRTELLVPTPNPASSSCVVEYEIVEKGRVRLYILSSAGSVTKTILDEQLEPGRRKLTVDTEGIPSGNYFLIMETPAKKRVTRLSIVK